MYTIKYLFYSSFSIKIIVTLLLFFLSLTIAIGISKIKKIIVIKKYIQSFEEQFWSGIEITQFYEANHKNNLNNPLGMIFKAVFEEWRASETLINFNTKQDIKERMLNVAHEKKITTMRTCEKYMDALTALIKIAPFLGLLGTIFGLIDVFYNLDLENGITITSAGIGIGGSMICLVFSLIVTITSMILFWFFDMNVKDVSDKIDGYIVDLLHFFYRNMDKIIAGGQDMNMAYNNINQIKHEQQTTAPAKSVEQQGQNEQPKHSESSTEDDV